MSRDKAAAGAGAGGGDGAKASAGERAGSRTAAEQQAVCSACGFASPAAFRYCGGCGSPLVPGAARSVAKPRAGERTQQPQRRQLTVLFCDLVGSSLLASRFELEEYRDLIRSYQDVCRSAIRRFDGTISRYMGDGILVLFGYPRAHEDDAERAVRAGLDIVRGIAALPSPHGTAGPEALAVRVGIATGLVVVGDIIGEGASEEEAVVGETPNLAARLQSRAAPNSVLVASGTRALLGERFDYADLGEQSLHGFTAPVRVSQVVGAREAGSRYETAQPLGRAPLVGRETHLAWLLALWRDAGQRRSRTALLGGEAGIGKSRVVEALRERIAGAEHGFLRYQCSPHYENTALHPVIEHVERAAGFGREDAPAAKMAKLSEWAGPATGADDAVALLGPLLSIPVEAPRAAPAMSPQRQKERTFEILVAYMQRLAARQPLLIVFEDLHWVDPTTQEFLTAAFEHLRQTRTLFILTFRPHYVPPWSDPEQVEHRELLGLGPEHALALAQHAAGARRLPRAVAEEVVAKTDGVPLFIEEMSKAVVDTGIIDDADDPQAPLKTGVLTAVPSTLHDSLMARLDQLGPAKAIAQVAGAIGREFSYGLLEAVSTVPPRRLREGLRVLERAGLIHADQRAPGSDYVFKHTLVQEVAYQSLLRSARRELHLQIARALESRFPQTARTAPELVAHHWTAAGNAERAVAGWLAAGRRASERSEYREAIGHLRTGLALVPQLADGSVRRDSELALRLALAPAIIISQGGGTPEVAALYARGLELCDGAPESATHFVANWGWWRASMDHRRGRERADRVLALARNLGEPALLLQAHHCQWATLYMLGAHAECCRHIDAGLGLYDSNRDRVDAGLYGGHDARVCGLGEGGLAQWILGSPQRAWDLASGALAWADELAHVGSRAHAMDFGIVLQRFRRDTSAVYQRAEALLAFATEQRLRVFRARGEFFRGWARAARSDDAAEGLGEMLAGMAAARGSDTPHDFTLYYEMLAEIYQRAGRLDEGMRAVDDGFDIAERHGIVYWNAELHRRRGELLRAAGERDRAEASFREALACAQAQEARSLELRAAASLARLHLAEGESPTARSVLRPVYESFREGFDTADLAEARQVIEAAG